MTNPQQPKIITDLDWKTSRREPAAAPSGASSVGTGTAGAGSGGASGAAAPTSGEGKILVDSDWKSQAQAEKERLAASEKAKAPNGEQDPRGGAMPPADFTSLVGTLVTQALLYLGGFPDPQTGRAIVSLEHARFHIDLLGVLEQRTKGNLSPEEASDMTQALHELRLRYVEIAQVVAQRAKTGKIG